MTPRTWVEFAIRCVPATLLLATHWPTPALAFEAPSRPPVILVALDNVRWDHTSLADYGRNTTPSLLELTQRPGTTTFTNAYSPATWSLPSYTSLFTGQSTATHGVGFTHGRVDETMTTLAEILSSHGYRTGAFTGGAHLSAEFGLAQGFEVYAADQPFLPLSSQVDPALEWVAGLRKADPSHPFFLFVHGYDAHAPYLATDPIAEMFDPDYRGPIHDFPELLTSRGIRRVEGDRYWPGFEAPLPRVHPTNPELGKNLGGRPAQASQPGDHYECLEPNDLNHLVAHYDSAIRTADYHLGRLLRGLDEQGVLHEAILVVLSDHGEALGENGYFRHGHELDEWAFRVPFVIHLPAPFRPQLRQCDTVVSLTDLLPTLTDLLGVVPPANVDGRSLSGLLLGPCEPLPPHAIWAAAKGGSMLRTQEWQVRFSGRQGGKMRTTLHRNGVGQDLLDEERPFAEGLLRSLVPPAGPRSTPSGPFPIEDDALREALADRGYWDTEGTVAGETP